MNDDNNSVSFFCLSLVLNTQILNNVSIYNVHTENKWKQC